MTQPKSAPAGNPANADALAEMLRANETASSEDLARIEAGLSRAMRQRRAAPSTSPRFIVFGVGLAASAVAIFWMTRRPSEAPVVAEPAREERVVPAPTPQPAIPALATGSSLALGEGQLRNARLSVGADSSLEVLDDTSAHAVVRLASGSVHVAFHPAHRGEEHLAIVTDVARVEVVGTEFDVTREPFGATHVSVTEGVVRVITLATREAHELRRGESLDVATATTTATATASATATATATAPPRLPSLDDAIAAADEGDTSALEAIAIRGDRASRLTALETLGDLHNHADEAAALTDYDRILAIDPTGERGATALHERAQLHERRHDTEAASDYALYLSSFPDGAFAAQARQHLCALDPARCTEP
jgi:hypothetical protein